MTESDTPDNSFGGADIAAAPAPSMPGPTDGPAATAYNGRTSMAILEPADKRRAAQLLRYAHPDHPDLAGINSMLEQAHDDRRLTHLTLAVAAIAYAVSELATDAGQSGLAELALNSHTQETSK